MSASLGTTAGACEGAPWSALDAGRISGMYSMTARRRLVDATASTQHHSTSPLLAASLQPAAIQTTDPGLESGFRTT